MILEEWPAVAAPSVVALVTTMCVLVSVSQAVNSAVKVPRRGSVECLLCTSSLFIKKGIVIMSEGLEAYGRNSARMKIYRVLADIRRNGHSKAQPFAVGRVENRMSDYAKANDITLASKSMYMSPRFIAHATRPSKTKKGLALTDKDFLNFPTSRRAMDLYFDGEKFIYTDYKAKFIVHPNYEMKIKGKKTQKVNLVTAGKVTDPKEFKIKKYRRI